MSLRLKYNESYMNNGSILLNGDCIEELKNIEDNIVDLYWLDLPYGQTSAKWDVLIDIKELWIQIMRTKKLHTPIFFCCTTKFGISLINSAPKKCPFRRDIVWYKSAPTGFLNSGSQEMRIHEMIYVFYEKKPMYDLSSHTHKFIKERDVKQKHGNLYTAPTPSIYNDAPLGTGYKDRKGSSVYSPPLPKSVIEPFSLKIIEDKGNNVNKFKVTINPNPTPIPSKMSDLYGGNRKKPILRCSEKKYDPPLPNSVLKIPSGRGHHSTTKPQELIKNFLKYYSKEGDVICDPTMGGGSCGVACREMNRNFIGIELDKEMYEYAVNRIEN